MICNMWRKWVDTNDFLYPWCLGYVGRTQVLVPSMGMDPSVWYGNIDNFGYGDNPKFWQWYGGTAIIKYIINKIHI